MGQIHVCGWAAAVLLTVAVPALSQPSQPSQPSQAATDLDLSAETGRLEFGLLGGMYASFPGSTEDPSASLLLSTPLWLGKRHRAFQFVVDTALTTGFGFDSSHVHATLAARVGGNLYFGPVFGLELRMGLGGIAQIGRHTVLGAGMCAGGGYVFRFWEDDRRRLKIEMNMLAGGFFAADPGNDLGTNALGIGWGLTYEMPL